MSKFNYDQIRPGYYDEVYHRNSGIQSRWHHKKFAAVHSCLPDAGLHLDIGCGPGTFIGNLPASRRLDSLGIDIAESQITYANNTYASSGRRFMLANLFDIDPLQHRYDAITFVEVLEHLPKPLALKMLVHARRLLKSNGRLIITTPNYLSFWPIIEGIVNNLGEVRYDDQHINRYTPKALEMDLKASGFTNYSISTFMSFSPFVAALSWKLSLSLSRVDSYHGSMKPMGMLLLATIENF